MFCSVAARSTDHRPAPSVLVEPPYGWGLAAALTPTRLLAGPDPLNMPVWVLMARLSAASVSDFTTPAPKSNSTTSPAASTTGLPAASMGNAVNSPLSTRLAVPITAPARLTVTLMSVCSRGPLPHTRFVLSAAATIVPA